MGIPKFAVEKATVTYFTSAVLFLVGIFSFFQLGQLEDPDFSLKVAYVITPYQGASPEEVEEEVTDLIETAVQEMTEVDYIESSSQAGLSIVKIEVRAEFWSDKLPQIWDTLRRKVRDVEGSLPEGSGRPIINDDVGDVYGSVLALTSDGFSDADMANYADDLRTQLLAVPGVGKVQVWGDQSEAIYIDYSRANLATLGIGEGDLFATLRGQNLVVDAGSIDIGDQRLRVETTGGIKDPADIAELIIRPSSGETEIIRLQDVGTVRRGYIEPASTRMRFNGRDAVAISVSGKPGENIVKLGARIDEKVRDLRLALPIGLELDRVHWQSDVVSDSVNSFIESFAQAVLIVLVVITLFMGWRMGIIIGTALILTITASFILMLAFGIDLQRMSLGALVIALGMMVDNAIVVADGTSARIAKGMNAKEAAIEAATLPAMPLLGATLIAVMTFYPIYASTDAAGEYCASLFSVVAIALFSSWIISITITPLQCIGMIKKPTEEELAKDPYGSKLYRTFKSILEGAIRFRFFTIAIMVALLVSALFSFTYVKQLFFPESSMEKFMVDLWAIEGSSLAAHSEEIRSLEAFLLEDDRVEDVVTFIGEGPPRFYLPVSPELSYASYAQLIVNVADASDIPELISKVNEEGSILLPGSLVAPRAYGVGPDTTYKFEMRITGPSNADPGELRDAAAKVEDVLLTSPLLAYVTTDWRQRTPVIQPAFDQSRGRFAQVSREDVSNLIKQVFDGSTVGVYREDDDVLPIILRNENSERTGFTNVEVLQLAANETRGPLPLAQVVNGTEISWEDPLIWRRDRLRTITVQANPIAGVTFAELMATVQSELDAIEFPSGYVVEMGGEQESNEKAQKSLIPGVVPAFLIVILTLVLLFNALRPPVLILLIVPFAIIGVSYGLLLSGAAFGFVALLGAMSLCGMIIKNAIVLIDEINLIKSEGKNAYDATIGAALSRLRPVALAAATTVLGVIPLLTDVFWVGLSVTIMAGLSFGTIVTMILLPTFYCTFYNARAETK
ncbi:MAG: efflux RND transporter permease subunit [Verrucomicrobiota bacterium]